MWTFSIFMFLIMILMGFSIGLTPLFSRQSTPFGVGIPADKQTDPFVEVRKKRFAIINVVISILLGLPLFIAPFIQDNADSEMIVGVYLTVAMFVFIIISFLLQLKYRQELLHWKETLPEPEKRPKITIDTTYQETLEVVSNQTLLISQLIIIAITTGLTLYFYDRIPEQIPVHWDVNFNVDRYAEKSLLTAMSLPFMQLIMVPVLNYSHYAFIRSKQKLSPNQPMVSKMKSQLFRKAWSTYMFIMTLSTQLLFTVIQFFSVFSLQISPWWMMVATIIYLVVIMGGMFYLIFKYGQAGEKLKLSEDDEGSEDYYTDAEEDKNWKLGVFYYNKEDPAVFVEKRFGIGSTMNMARWQAWVVIAGLILFILVSIFWSYWVM